MFKRTALALSLALGAGAAGAGPGDLVNQAQPGLCDEFRRRGAQRLRPLLRHTRSWSEDKAVAHCDPVRQAEVPVMPVAAPEPLPAPAPEPKLVVSRNPCPRRRLPAPAPTIKRVTLDTELLFDFDSAALRPAGRAKLQELALEVRGAKIQSIDAIGHADRIASESYNQQLSKERAASVKDYLVRLGFDPSTIDAEGRGEADPVTGARCAGLGAENRDNLKLVRCLQPDRRVELEVKGVQR